MSNWSGGYVVDQAYVREYYEELAPAHLDFAAIQGGVLPPQHGRGRFKYLDLGCGHGLVPLVVAASNPEAEVHGIDFMPDHIASARHLAREMGIENVHYHELSFGQALDADLPAFDYIVAHGVYAWVMPEVRAELVRFIGHALAPGGLLYISYNALPGRAMLTPLRQVLWEYGRRLPGASTENALEAIAFLKKLSEVEASAIQRNPYILHKIDELAEKPSRYLAHEYLNDEWHPAYVTEVMAEMAGAKLSFVSSAEILKNRTEWNLTQPQIELVQELPTVAMRELGKDFCINASFRKDIYTRGGVRLSDRERLIELGKQVIALKVAPGEIQYEADLGAQTIDFGNEASQAIVQKLGEGAFAINALEDIAGLDAALTTVESLLVSSQAVVAMRPEGTGPLPFNAQVGVRSVGERPVGVTASPMGTAVVLGIAEQIAIGLCDDAPTPETLAGRMLQRMEGVGRLPVRDGEALMGDEAVAHLTPEATQFLRGRAPALRNLGIVA